MILSSDFVSFRFRKAREIQERRFSASSVKMQEEKSFRNYEAVVKKYLVQSLA